MRPPILSTFLILALSATWCAADGITLLTEDTPPVNYLDENQKPAGLSVELVVEMARRVGDPGQIRVVPWARGYKDVREKPNTAFFSTAHSPERDPLFKWVGPLLYKEVVLYKKKGGALKIATLDDAKKVDRVGAYKDDSKEQLLKKLGFANLDSSLDDTANPKKLVAGRIDLWISTSIQAGATCKTLIANGVEGVVIRVDDVTEQVRIEEMMVQSEKMLSVGGLAAGMAREINNPLAGMIQTASVLNNRLTQDMPVNDRAAKEAGTTMVAVRAFMESREVPQMLEVIRASGKRAAQIVHNMLSFARKSDSTISGQDIAALLDQTVDLSGSDYDLKKKFDFRRIEIVREYEENLPPVPCEPVLPGFFVVTDSQPFESADSTTKWDGVVILICAPSPLTARDCFHPAPG